MVSADPEGERPQSLTVAIVGAGPAGLMAAEILAKQGLRVIIFDRMASVGRKFLMAGRGGLNLTHSEPLETFLSRYGANASTVANAITAFPPAKLISWCEGLGQETFIGSSGRVFPKSYKASPLLRAWLGRLSEAGAEFRLRSNWTGWTTAGALMFETPDGETESLAADAVILALGGASWPRLGSDGRWMAPLTATGAGVVPFEASNCGVRVAWSSVMTGKHGGQALKRIAVTSSGVTRRGEAVITADGLEGNVIYALSGTIRASLKSTGSAALAIDLRPDESVEMIASRLSGYRGRQSMATFLRKALKLSPAAIALLHEVSAGRLPADQMERARLIKAVPLTVSGLAGIDRAISSSGGVALDAIDGNFMLRAKPGVFVAGEMIDWDAPTGGYLLQACFATGIAAASGVTRWLQGLQAAREMNSVPASS